MMRQPVGARQQEISRPQLIQSMIDAMRVPDLRGKILFTLAMLVVFRFVAHVPVPGVDPQALTQAFESQALLGFLDLFSGGALSRLSVAALGVYPYITASIVMQILVPVIPNLKALSQEGEYGRQKINQFTHYLAVPIAALQAWGQLTLLQQAGVLPFIDFGVEPADSGYGRIDDCRHDVPRLAGRANHRARTGQRHIAHHIRRYRGGIPADCRSRVARKPARRGASVAVGVHFRGDIRHRAVHRGSEARTRAVWSQRISRRYGCRGSRVRHSCRCA